MAGSREAGGFVNHAVKPCSHVTSAFSFTSIITEGCMAVNDGDHTKSLYFQEFDGNDQRKTPTQTLRVIEPLIDSRLRFTIFLFGDMFHQCQPCFLFL